MRRLVGTAPRRSRTLLLLGLTLGALSEGLLLLRAEAGAAEARLHEDFRIVVFFREGLDAARRTVVEEKLRALAGVAELRSVPPAASLRTYAAEDPELAQAVAFLGENPLPDAAELRLSDEGLRRLPELVSAAQAMPETGEAVFKPLQAQALLRLQFHRRLLTLLLALLAGLWALAAARRLWPVALGRAPLPGSGSAAPVAAGAAVGMALVLLAAWPARGAGGLEGWPGALMQAALLGACAAAGWVLGEGSRGSERPHAARPVVVVSFLAALLLLPSAAGAADARRRQKELQRIQEQLSRKREEAREYQRRQAEAQKQLSTILDDKQRAQRSLLDLSGRRREAAARAEEFSERLGAIRNAKGIDRRLLVEQVRAYARVLARTEPAYGRSGLWKESFERAALVGRLRRLGGLRRAEGGAAHQQERARSEERVFGAKAAQAQGDVEHQEQLYQSRQQDAREAGRKASEALAAARELEESARALANLLGDLERKRRAAGGRAPAPVPLHSLPWPSEGQVLSRFGKTQVAGLKTWSIQNGIRIAAPAGSRVRAVSAGRVIFDGPFRSYGNVLIVEHDEGFFGIYGGLDQALVHKGARVPARGEIAVASGDGGGLYFEVRRGQAPLDPLTLLERR
ncbi:MAG: permease-like cell division protein FtsX [Elusimicrobiota bacterium]|jgi:septal ring factor EnvC (AmiA/AmiB activator)